MQITVNGRPTRTQAKSLADLVEALNEKKDAVAIAVNAHIVPRTDWPQQFLAAKDYIDIFRA